MKLKDLLFGVSALCAISAVTFSCTTEMVSPYPGANAGMKPSMLVHAPDFFAWSGNQQLGSYGSRSDDDIVITVNDITTTNLNQNEEKTYVDKTLPEESDNLPDYIDDDFVYYTTQETRVQLFLVFSQTGQDHEFGLFYYTKSGEMKTQVIWESVDKNNFQWDGVCKGKEVIIPAGIFFGFYLDKGNNIFPVDSETHWNTVDPGPLYSSSSLNPASYHVVGNGDWSCDTNSTPSKQHAVTWTRTLDDGTTRSYIGFEDWCDFDFQDLVFTYTPDIKTVNSTDFEPGQTEIPDDPGNDDDVCGKCGHKHKPGTDCDECENKYGDGQHGECYPEPDGPDTPDGPTGPTTPTTPIDPVLHNDEVEVNFSINDVHPDYEFADLWTKLSIHVRKGTDVRIRVPLPGKYLCVSDDFDILQNHYNGIYTGVASANGSEVPGAIDDDNIYTHSMTYTINGKVDDVDKTWNVTLTVSIDLEGMTVETSGIDQDLIDYLFEKNGDGINFEIWNYYQTETVDYIDGQKQISGVLDEQDYEKFQEYLNASTITFIDEAPSYYINAFGFNWANGIYDQGRRPKDCYVRPADESLFNMFPNFCYHLNGTPWNIIWINKAVDPSSEGYADHTITAKPPVAVGTLPAAPSND